jgi:hypothetical protein
MVHGRPYKGFQKNCTIPVPITHHWNLIPSNIAKIREKLHSFMFSFKFHSFFFHSLFFHSNFILSFTFVGGVVACLDALLTSASRRSLGVVCMCSRDNYAGLRSGERRQVAFCFNAKPRISSRSKSRYRQNLSHL